MYAFESQEGFTFSIAAKFFVISSPLAATKFARMSAGFYTSVLFLSFLDPLGSRAAFGIPVTNTTSKKQYVLHETAALSPLWIQASLHSLLPFPVHQLLTLQALS